MSNLKVYNSDTSQWEYVVIGKQGPTGQTGATGPAGNDGALSPNYIINGAFDIWQRGTSFVNPANYTPTADRWFFQASGAAATITQETFTPDELNVVGFGDANHYMKIDVTGADDNAGMVTRIEDVRTLAGQEVTLSFWVKSTATELKTVFYQNFGSGGSTLVSHGSLRFTPTDTWTRYQRTITLPSISGKTIGTGSYIQIEFANPTNETSVMQFWGVQLEAGSVATPFKRNAPSIQGELAACRRYFVGVGTNTNGARLSTGMVAGSTVAVFQFPFTMRTTPSISVSDLADWTISSSAGTTSVTGLSTILDFTGVVTLNLLSSGMSANNVAQIRQQGTTARMFFDAEL